MRRVYVSEVIDELGLSKFTWMVFLVLLGAMIFDGLDYMIVSFTMPQISKEWALTKVQTGSLASWGLLGLVIGGAISGLISDRIGRKKTLIWACVFYSLLTFLIYFAPNFETFAILRVLAGVGLGAFIPVCVTLISEFAPTKVRGVFVSSSLAAIVFGWVIAGLVAIPIVPRLGWRPCYVIGCVSLLYALVIAMLPESIHWLLSKGRGEKAVDIIRRMEESARGVAREWSPENLLVPPPPRSVGVGALFSREYCLSTIGLMLMFFLGYTSVYGVTSWMPTLLLEKGLPIAKSYGYSVGLNVGAAIGNVFTGWVGDKIGRKRNIVFGFLVAALAIIFLAYASGEMQTLAACVFVGLTINYALTGIQPLSAEVYRTEFRNTGVAWTQAFGRLGGFLAPIFAGYVQQRGAGFSGTLLWFVIPAVVGAIVTAFFVRYETKGKRLEDIASEVLGGDQ